MRPCLSQPLILPYDVLTVSSLGQTQQEARRWGRQGCVSIATRLRMERRVNMGPEGKSIVLSHVTPASRRKEANACHSEYSAHSGSYTCRCQLHHLSVINPAPALLFHGANMVILYLLREGTTDEDGSVRLYSSDHVLPQISHSSMLECNHTSLIDFVQPTENSP